MAHNPAARTMSTDGPSSQRIVFFLGRFLLSSCSSCSSLRLCTGMRTNRLQNTAIQNTLRPAVAPTAPAARISVPAPPSCCFNSCHCSCSKYLLLLRLQFLLLLQPAQQSRGGAPTSGSTLLIIAAHRSHPSLVEQKISTECPADTVCRAAARHAERSE